ncbi:MAG: translation initiation factor IF-2 [Oligoflexia bacterium]|nr:translation initiation factor IF-2 [Oligoflexia bacterium]
MPKKIYELANEMAIGALDLVEKLKKLGFSIRNHMSTLSDEEIAKFNDTLNSDKDKNSSANKKKVIKRKTKSEDEKVADQQVKQVKEVGEVTGVTKVGIASATTTGATITSGSVVGVGVSSGVGVGVVGDEKLTEEEKRAGVVKRKTVVRKKAGDASSRKEDVDHEHSMQGHGHGHGSDSGSGTVGFGSDEFSHDYDGSMHEQETNAGDSSFSDSSGTHPNIKFTKEELSADDDFEANESSLDKDASDTNEKTTEIDVGQHQHLHQHQQVSTKGNRLNNDEGQVQRGLRVVYRPPATPSKQVETTTETTASDGERISHTSVHTSGTAAGNAELTSSSENLSKDDLKSKRVDPRGMSTDGKLESVESKEAKKTSESAKKKDDKYEFYEEKMHIFTPVYIPPKKDPLSVKKDTPSTSQGKEGDISQRRDRVGVRRGGPSATTSATSTSDRSTTSVTTAVGTGVGTGALKNKLVAKKISDLMDYGESGETKVLGADDSDKDDDKTSKKRVGGLAAIMSKPKKVKDVVQLRADEELKSYAVGLVGKIVYTPVGKKKIYSGPTKETNITEVKDTKRVIEVYKGCTASELAQKLKIKFEDLKNQCLEINLLIRDDDYFGVQLLNDICELYKYRVHDTSFKEELILNRNETGKDKEKKSRDGRDGKDGGDGEAGAGVGSDSSAKDESEENTFPLRSPIVTVMGHVDHGKTTLLDTIRETNVVQGEAGGITQHIGAYTVKTASGEQITFIDTPGHAAFQAMRERGASITDLVVLVVAADDGVMPQTKESIRFCKNHKVPIIVAVNKVDKEGVNTQRIRQDLMEFHLTPEEWGGDTQYVEISALKKTGIDKLLESICLQAEMMELRADPDESALGVVIESRMETGKGALVSVLIKKGTLHKSDYVVIGETYGRIRGLIDDKGQTINEAGPSTPVQILGLNAPPNPGDTMNVVKSEREAKKIVDNRIDSRKELSSIVKPKLSLEDFLTNSKNEGEEKKILKLILRTDVLGSYEAIKASLANLGNQEVGIDVIGGGVGAITDTDVQLAQSAGGYIIGFGVSPTTTARKISEDFGVDIKNYRIIYELIDEVKLALEGLLTPETVEKYIGRAEVRNVFVIPKAGTIAGSAVIDGRIEKGCGIRLIRDGKIMYEGKISTLRRFKDDVKEVKNGYECGIALENYDKVQVNDIFEAFVLESKKRTLESNNNSQI